MQAKLLWREHINKFFYITTKPDAYSAPMFAKLICVFIVYNFYGYYLDKQNYTIIEPTPWSANTYHLIYVGWCICWLIEWHPNEAEQCSKEIGCRTYFRTLWNKQQQNNWVVIKERIYKCVRLKKQKVNITNDRYCW